jgi:hypothetical protein
MTKNYYNKHDPKRMEFFPKRCSQCGYSDMLPGEIRFCDCGYELTVVKRTEIDPQNLKDHIDTQKELKERGHHEG